MIGAARTSQCLLPVANSSRVVPGTRRAEAQVDRETCRSRPELEVAPNMVSTKAMTHKRLSNCHMCPSNCQPVKLTKLVALCHRFETATHRSGTARLLQVLWCVQAGTIGPHIHRHPDVCCTW